MTATFIGAAAGAGAATAPLTEQQKADAAVRLLHAFNGTDARALAIIDQNHYTQHNLRLGDGLNGLRKRLATVAPGSSVDVVRVLLDGTAS